jgi:hypothetical protein
VTPKMRQRQAAMKARNVAARKQDPPWSHVNEEQARQSVLRMRALFKMGLSDEKIGEALDLDAQLVSILRHARCGSRRARFPK